MGIFQNIKTAKAIQSLSRLSPEDRDACRLPIVYGNNDFLLTKRAAWVTHSVPTKPWGYLKDSDKVGYFLAANNFFNRNFPGDTDNAGHLVVTNHVYSAEQWQDALLEKNAERALPGFERYLEGTVKSIDQAEFFSRDIYLMTRLGERGEYKGISGFVREMSDFFANGFGLDDSQPTDDEVERWRQQAEQVDETFSGSWFRMEPITRQRTEWLVRHLDTPALPTPDVAPADRQTWGIGEWQTTLAAYTEVEHLGMSGKNRVNCVRFEAPTGAGTSYAAFLPIAHMPEKMSYRQAWMQHAASLDFPVDISVHFEVIDPERAKNDMEKAVAAAETQANDDQESGYNPDDRLMDQHQQLRALKRELETGRLPMMYWQAVFMVSDTNKERLLSKVTRLVRHYKDIDFELVTPPDDQRELFYQSFPGSDVLVNDWMMKTKADFFVAGQPWVATSVGDTSGLYQGFTVVLDSNGTPTQGQPVFFDLQNVVDDEGQAPTEQVWGEPGSGKTVSRGLKTALEDGYKGLTQFIWDPKGDFIPLKAYAKQMLLDPSKVHLIDLYDPNASISLDAFAIAEVDTDKGIDERLSTAVNTIETLARKYVDSNVETYSQLIRKVANWEMTHYAAYGRTQPSMNGVMGHLSRWATNEGIQEVGLQPHQVNHWVSAASALFEQLSFVQKDTLGRLLFADPSNGGAMRVEAGTMTIFVALNMQPTEEGEDPDAVSIIHDTIAGMMADYIRSLLYRLPDHEPKVLQFDEWHVIKRTRSAEALVNWLRRMGRSKRAQVRQLSQNADDFGGGSLSTMWAGYAKTQESAIASCQKLEIEASETNIRTLMSFGPGEFLFRDHKGRIARVKVDIWDEWLLEKFNTQAAQKEQLLKELKAAEAVAATPKHSPTLVGAVA